MSTFFPKSNGPTVQQAPLPDGEEAWRNEYDARIAAQIERMAKPRAPMYTPEQVEQRRGQNDREYQLGLIGMLSGQENLGEAGGLVFKNALSQRQPHVTERGVADKITGQFNYNPDYLEEKDQVALEHMYAGQAALNEKHYSDLRHDRRARDIAADRNVNRITVVGMGGGAGGLGSGPLQPMGVDAQGNPAFHPTKGGKGDLITFGPNGQPQVLKTTLLPKPTGGGPSEDERKSKMLLDQSTAAFTGMRAAQALDPDAAKVGLLEKTIGTLTPKKVGDDLAYATMTGPRQQFVTAANSLKEALLHAATGAGFNAGEEEGKIREMIPRYGEDPNVSRWKEGQARMYLESLKQRAGRAATPANTLAIPGMAGAPDAGASEDDPIGMRALLNGRK